MQDVALLLQLIQYFYSSWVVVRWLLLVLLLLQTTSAALQPVLPKSGLVVSEKGGLSELLCKPKILPLKSATLKRLEALQVCAGPASSQPCDCQLCQRQLQLTVQTL